MLKLLRDWIQRYFSDPQAVMLAFFLFLGAVIILTMGKILAPVLAGVIIAYLLEGLVGRLERLRFPRTAAALLVFLIFMAFVLVLLLGLLPLISRQIAQLVGELPAMIGRIQAELMRLPEKYPGLISKEQVATLFRLLATELGNLGQQILSLSVASVRGIIAFLVYLIVVPLMVFFFLKDKQKIIGWLLNFVPENQTLSRRVWQEVDQQIGNYIRGKFLEILIVWAASYITFYLLGLQFAMLNGLLVGLSVLIPYIGAIAAFFPPALMAYFQWGFTSDTLSVVIAYTVIQLVDGNLLVTLLLSGVVNLHPVAIIIAVLVFGGLWGFWGVFFAIPLATLIQAVLRAWPRSPLGGNGETPDCAP